MNLGEKDAVLLLLRGKGRLLVHVSTLLRPEIRSLAQTVDCLVDQPNVTWRHQLKVVKYSGRP